MTDFRILIGDPETGRTFQKALQEEESRRLFGKRVGETFRGELFGLTGYQLKITGGTDSDGCPIRPEVEGTGRTKILLATGPGYKPTRKGMRKRKMVRGKIIGPDIAQLNTRVVKAGKKKLEDLLKKEEEEQEK